MTIKPMLESDISPIYDEVADFFASSPSAQQVTEFRLSDASERLISDLLEANRTRGLTPEEQAALDDYTRIERLMQAIKVRAFAKVNNQPDFVSLGVLCALAVQPALTAPSPDRASSVVARLRR